MDIKEKNLKTAISAFLLLILVMLAFFIIKPVAFAIIYGVLLAYIFHPVYRFVLKGIKNETLSALIVCLLLLLIILVPIIIIFNVLFNQVINAYLSLQSIDWANTIKQAIPPEFSSEILTKLIDSLNELVPKIISYLITKFSGFVLNIPVLMLYIFVSIFVFFFSLKDGVKMIEYIRSLAPFSKDTADKFYNQFKDITNSVLLGQIVVGIIQGLVAGVGYWIFGIDYVIVLTIITIIMSIIPLIGAWFVWVPIDIYLFATGKSGPALGLLIYGLLVVSLIDNVLRTYIVSRKTEINPAIVVIGMIGGLLTFGFLGFILGPLVIAYILLVIEIYRKNKSDGNIFLKEVKKTP